MWNANNLVQIWTLVTDSISLGDNRYAKRFFDVKYLQTYQILGILFCYLNKYLLTCLAET